MARSRRGKLTIAFVAVVVLLLVLVLLLPTLASLGPARGMIAGAVSKRVNGTASVDRVKLSWLGAQSVRGLSVVEPGGREAVRADVTVSSGLLALVLGTVDELEVGIGGALRGDLREDGSTSFGDLIADDAAAPGGKAASPGAPDRAPLRLEGVPRVRVELADLAVTLSRPGAADVQLDGLKGHVAYAPGGDASMELESTTTAGDLRGSVALRGSTKGLFAADGTMTPAGAVVDAEVRLRRLPVPFAEQVEMLSALDLTAHADDLARALDVGIKAEANAVGAAPSVLEGAISLARPFTPNGRLVVGLDRIRGQLQGRAVPTALAQPFLAGSPVLLSRDLGPTADVAARFEPGAEDGPVIVEVAVTGARASLELAGTVNEDGSLDGERLRVEASVQPDLARAVAGAWVTTSTALRAEFGPFRVPARGEDGTLPLGALALTGTIALPGPVTIAPPEEKDAAVVVRDARLELATTALRDGLRARGGAALDDGRLELDVAVADLLDASGTLALDDALPLGTVTLTGLEGAKLATILRAVLPPDAALVRDAAPELLVGPTRASITTSRADTGVGVQLALGTERVEATASAVRRSDALHLASAELALTATPRLAAIVLGEDEPSVTLAEPARASLTLTGLDLPGSSWDAIALPDAPIPARLAIERAALAHAELAEPLVVRDLDTMVTARLGAAPEYALRGKARLERAGDQPLAGASWDVTARTEEEALVPAGTVALTGLVVASAEALLGTRPGAFADWVGAGGNVTVEAAGVGRDRTVTLRTELSRLQGALRVALDEESLRVASDEVRLTVAAAALERALNQSEEGAPEAASSKVTVPEDLPITAQVGELTLPLAALRDEPFDPAAVNVDVSLSGGPLVLADAAGRRSGFERVIVSATTSDLAQGLEFVLRSQTRVRDADTGTLDIKGRAYHLVDAERRLAGSESYQFNADVTADGVPTAVADTLLGLDGLLVAAVGPAMKATAAPRGFSRRSGWMDLRIDTTNGFLEGRIKSRDPILHTTKEEPIHGALAITPPLRQRLLRKIHPIFADVRTVEDDIRFRVPTNAQVPLDGDLSRLHGELEITVGDVAFEAGSTTLGLLALFNETPTQTIPGSIEPIVARVRSGVVTYERFAVNIGKYKLVYAGNVNLVTRTVDLRTEIPLEGLAMTFRELEGYVDKITVPLVTRGALDDPKTEIDPSFDFAGAAAAAGFRGAIGEVLRGQGLPADFGRIFDGLRQEREEKKGK